MFKTIQDFTNSWQYESATTLKMLQNLTNESLTQKISPEGRDLAWLAWHISTTMPEMMLLTGLNVVGADSQETDAPYDVQKLKDEYEASSKSLLNEVTTKWTDADLDTEDNMYGMQWKKGATLHMLITHQAHHRGQMSVVMRQAGLPIPGAYGPSREEWVAIGRTPLK